MSDDEPKNTEPRNLLDVLDTLVAERGGADCFSAVQMMSARALVRCLGAMCNGDMVRAGSIEVLERMLPPKVDASSAPMDLEKLSDRELGALQRLIEIGQGIKPSREHKPRSARRWLSDQLADVLDAAEKRPGGANEIDKIECRSLMCSLLSPLWRGEDFWPPYLSALPVPAEPAPNVAAEPESVAPNNVVPLRSAPARTPAMQ
jgi:hypothetical protein